MRIRRSHDVPPTHEGMRRLYPLIDAHLHLDDAAFDADRDTVVQRAREAGVVRMLAVGSNLESSRRAVALAARYEEVYAAIGLHPHEASSFDRNWRSLKALLDEPKVVAVGEIGLDWVRSDASEEDQRKVFRAQLGWAKDRDLPVSVHNREADGDVLEEMSTAGVRAVLHCFSGNRPFAEQAVGEGFLVSFAGNVTFPRADVLRDAVSAVPLDRLLVETDSPVLAPQPWRGRRNEPAYVAAIVNVIASVLDLTAEEVATRTCENAAMLFRWGSV